MTDYVMEHQEESLNHVPPMLLERLLNRAQIKNEEILAERV